MQSVRNVCKGNKFTVASSISRSYNLYEAASTSGWEVAEGKFSDKSAASGRNVYTCIPDGRGGFSCFFEVSVVYTARKFQPRIEAFSGVTVQRQDLAVKILENYRSVETAISWRHTFSVHPAAKTSTNRRETCEDPSEEPGVCNKRESWHETGVNENRWKKETGKGGNKGNDVNGKYEEVLNW